MFFSDRVHLHRSHRLGTMPYARVQRDYGTEIADLVSAFAFSDPYEMCFALLYLLDRDSDLPWLYYPGIVLSENAGAMLPWYDGEYDESEDAHWDEYYGVEPRLVRPEVKNAPELPDSVKEDAAPEIHASLEDLQARAADLKRENDRLKQAAYEAERELRELRKKQDALLQKSQAERQELAQLRELVFLRENAGEDEEDRETVTFPYTVRHSIVVFGGHETWAKAIRPMLAGEDQRLGNP